MLGDAGWVGHAGCVSMVSGDETTGPPTLGLGLAPPPCTASRSPVPAGDLETEVAGRVG